MAGKYKPVALAAHFRGLGVISTKEAAVFPPGTDTWIARFVPHLALDSSGSAGSTPRHKVGSLFPALETASGQPPASFLLQLYSTPSGS